MRNALTLMFPIFLGVLVHAHAAEPYSMEELYDKKDPSLRGWSAVGKMVHERETQMTNLNEWIALYDLHQRISQLETQHPKDIFGRYIDPSEILEPQPMEESHD
jgi:hypothetical protein